MAASRGNIMQADKKTVDVNRSLGITARQSFVDRTRKAKGMKGDLMVTLSAGESDLAALTSVVTEWLVPLLVQQFLNRHEVDRGVSSNKSSTEPRGKEGAANNRIR
jgi:hypothetical protein